MKDKGIKMLERLKMLAGIYKRAGEKRSAAVKALSVVLVFAVVIGNLALPKREVKAAGPYTLNITVVGSENSPLVFDQFPMQLTSETESTDNIEFNLSDDDFLKLAFPTKNVEGITDYKTFVTNYGISNPAVTSTLDITKSRKISVSKLAFNDNINTVNVTFTATGFEDLDSLMFVRNASNPVNIDGLEISLNESSNPPTIEHEGNDYFINYLIRVRNDAAPTGGSNDGLVKWLWRPEDRFVSQGNIFYSGGTPMTDPVFKPGVDYEYRVSLNGFSESFGRNSNGKNLFVATPSPVLRVDTSFYVDSNEGTLNGGVSQTGISEILNNDGDWEVNVSFPEVTAKPGYVFKGWKVAPDSGLKNDSNNNVIIPLKPNSEYIDYDETTSKVTVKIKDSFASSGNSAGEGFIFEADFAQSSSNQLSGAVSYNFGTHVASFTQGTRTFTSNDYSNGMYTFEITFPKPSVESGYTFRGFKLDNYDTYNIYAVDGTTRITQDTLFTAKTVQLKITEPNQQVNLSFTAQVEGNQMYSIATLKVGYTFYWNAGSAAGTYDYNGEKYASTVEKEIQITLPGAPNPDSNYGSGYYEFVIPANDINEIPVFYEPGSTVQSYIARSFTLPGGGEYGSGNSASGSLADQTVNIGAGDQRIKISADKFTSGNNYTYRVNINADKIVTKKYFVKQNKLDWSSEGNTFYLSTIKEDNEGTKYGVYSVTMPTLDKAGYSSSVIVNSGLVQTVAILDDYQLIAEDEHYENVDYLVPGENYLIYQKVENIGGSMDFNVTAKHALTLPVHFDEGTHTGALDPSEAYEEYTEIRDVDETGAWTVGIAPPYAGPSAKGWKVKSLTNGVTANTLDGYLPEGGEVSIPESIAKNTSPSDIDVTFVADYHDTSGTITLNLKFSFGSNYYEGSEYASTVTVPITMAKPDAPTEDPVCGDVYEFTIPATKFTEKPVVYSDSRKVAADIVSRFVVNEEDADISDYTQYVTIGAASTIKVYSNQFRLTDEIDMRLNMDAQNVHFKSAAFKGGTVNQYTMGIEGYDLNNSGNIIWRFSADIPRVNEDSGFLNNQEDAGMLNFYGKVRSLGDGIQVTDTNSNEIDYLSRGSRYIFHIPDSSFTESNAYYTRFDVDTVLRADVTVNYDPGSHYSIGSAPQTQRYVYGSIEGNNITLEPITEPTLTPTGNDTGRELLGWKLQETLPEVVSISRSQISQGVYANTITMPLSYATSTTSMTLNYVASSKYFTGSYRIEPGAHFDPSSTIPGETQITNAEFNETTGAYTFGLTLPDSVQAAPGWRFAGYKLTGIPSDVDLSDGSSTYTDGQNVAGNLLFVAKSKTSGSYDVELPLVFVAQYEEIPAPMLRLSFESGGTNVQELGALSAQPDSNGNYTYEVTLPGASGGMTLTWTPGTIRTTGTANTVTYQVYRQATDTTALADNAEIYSGEKVYIKANLTEDTPTATWAPGGDPMVGGTGTFTVTFNNGVAFIAPGNWTWTIIEEDNEFEYTVNSQTRVRIYTSPNTTSLQFNMKSN